MFVLLPVLCFILIYFCLLSRHPLGWGCWRRCLLLSSVLWGICIVGSTEVLSLFHLIRWETLAGFWGTLSLALAGALYKSHRDKHLNPFRFLPSRTRLKNLGFSATEISLLCLIALFAVVTAVTAFLAPPNTWDSMTYHMGRVVHWIQNQSLAPYPTHIPRQLYMTPWAEMVLLHLQILSNGDRFANLVQWFSMIGSLVGVSLLAQQLGANRRAQILSSLIAATIPMGILQSSSTQNDYVVAFWILSFLNFALMAKKDPRLFLISTASSSLGLAVLTKPTAYIYAFPFLIWFFYALFLKMRRNIWKPVCVLAVILVSLNLGHGLRTIQLYGAPLATGEDAYRNEVFSIPAWLSNILRNISLHLRTPSQPINEALDKTIRWTHRQLPIDINDPRTTWDKYQFPNVSLDEDYAGNLPHLFLILLASWLCLSRKFPGIKDIKGYTFSTLSAFLLFCLLLKWQPWHARLHLAFFLIAAPLISILLSSAPRPWPTALVAAVLSVYALPWLFFCNTRPLLGPKNIFHVPRLEQYFAKRPDIHAPYDKTGKYIKSGTCADIGLIGNGDYWEYPFWVFLKENPARPFRVEHVDVENISSGRPRAYPLGRFDPCVMVQFHERDAAKISDENGTYVKVRRFNFIDIFLKDETGTLSRTNMVYHFTNVLASLGQTMPLLNNQPPFETFGEKDVKKIIYLRREWQEAQLVDPEELNQMYAGLGDRFKTSLVHGLELRLAGYITSNQARYDAGKKLILTWLIWFHQNKDALIQALQSEKK
ncbi:MAG TPA: 4-amino-4-deoxy-L-arabinose transferase [Candidatus Omnitrophica bacterium]|nr:MAG: hypothetical protein A2Z81_06755 [Omnitrophica WOR_2 bacterium GWA2_45_18]HBR15081.1 4-amino-4-deoxy-L-arabinose transferase [Candidatus Omnitrophota bacterium]